MYEERDGKDIKKDIKDGPDPQSRRPVFKTLTYAVLLEKQGYISEAKRIYEALLTTYPRGEVIKRRLERLKKVF